MTLTENNLAVFVKEMSDLLDNHEGDNLERNSILHNNDLLIEEEYDLCNKKGKVSGHQQGIINSAKSANAKENKFFTMAGKIPKKK